MNANPTTRLPELGVLRNGLLLGGLINILLSIIGLALVAVDAGYAGSIWDTVAIVITPVMAPLFVVVIFFDYLMSKLRAGDTESDPADQAFFGAVARVEGYALILSMGYWVPYFIWRL